MIYKNCDGRIPEPGPFTVEDEAILAAADGIYAKAREEMNTQAITRYLDHVFAVIAEANRYFAAEEPWAKKKTDPKRMETVLYVTAELVRQFAILLAPVMPDSCAKLLDLLAIGRRDPASAEEGLPRTFKALGRAGRLVPGTAIPEPEGVFPRYVDPAEETEKSSANSREAQAAAKAAKEAKRAAEREKAKREKDAKG
jgi:methionyl-tRNA synthetase